MCSKIAIEVKNLSKVYNIYDQPHKRLLQMFFRGYKHFFREFWAMRDVSFSVNKGETVGIIGRNGSGKSTLLQMICGTLNQTSGSIKTNGRIAALLELGSGFNPEFTGRENIYLNAAVLGLTREAIDLRYDEIVSFADIGDYIDQPVKTYSSGMQVRLAFSVAINVSPDILIVDEALSVGDAFFQAKCAKVISNIIAKGTTVLFVSHDISSVKALCDRAILLQKGEIIYFGDVNTATEKYYEAMVQNKLPAKKTSQKIKIDSFYNNKNIFEYANNSFNKMAEFQRIGNNDANFINVVIVDQSGKKIETIDFGQKIILKQFIRINKKINKLDFAYHIRDKNGFDLVYSDTAIEGGTLYDLQVGDTYVVDWEFDVNLKEGDYVLSSMASMPIDLKIADVEEVDFIPISAKFSVAKRNPSPIYSAVYWKNKLSINKI